MIHQELFGTTPEGEAVEVFSLSNANQVSLRVISYGCIISDLQVPDRNGVAGDIVLGFETLDAYLAGHPYFGAVVGRYGNRIAGGRFELDGVEYRLATNNGANHIHGGVRGFDKVIWQGEPFTSDQGVGVAFSYTSPDGEEGYPGTLMVRLSYTLTERNQLICDYQATTDRATHINLTQHSYFNLAGAAAGDILDHQVMIDADCFVPVDAALVPTGELRSVVGTPFDLRRLTAIGAAIDQDHEQLEIAGGYDHSFVLNRSGQSPDPASAPTPSPTPSPSVTVYESTAGRVLEVATSEPGVQLYTGNFLDGSLIGKHGYVYGKRCGLCLETQHFPDSPNQPAFPSTILRPGEHYTSRTVFTFSSR